MRKLKIVSNYTTILTEGILQIIIACVLAAALIYKVKFLILLCICILVLGLCAKAWTRFSLNKVEQHIKPSAKRAFPKDPIQVKVHLKNKKFLPVLMRFKMRGKAIETLLHEAGLLSFSDYKFEWTLTYPKRGVYSLGPVEVSAGDLLGFYSIRESQAPLWEIIIYPQLIPFLIGSLKSEEFFGDHFGKNFVTDPIMVAGTREYTSSRPAKNIHWMASAKTGVLQEKILEPSTHNKVMLIVDVKGFQEAGATDEFETMLSKAATSIVELSKKGISPALMVNGTMTGISTLNIEGEASANAVYRKLEALARLSMNLDLKRDELINANTFKATSSYSYLYFCYSGNENISTLEKNNKMIQFVIS